MLACLILGLGLLTPIAAQQPNSTASAEVNRIRNAFTSSEPATNGDQAKVEVNKILDKPLYRDSIEKHEDWWLSDAIERMLERLFKRKERPKGPNLNIGFAGDIIKLVVICIGAALLVLLVYLLTQVIGKRTAKKMAHSEGILDEDEPLLSSDEWLDRADQLAAAQRYREAVRCLFVAMLMRLDEANVLRFERHETNWEHLYRYRDLESKPGGFDLQVPTQRFDSIWYGFRDEGEAGVAYFRDRYQELLSALRGRA